MVKKECKSCHNRNSKTYDQDKRIWIGDYCHLSTIYRYF